MQKYSEQFRSEMIRKMTGAGAVSALRLSKECGVGQPTLSGWLGEAKLKAVIKVSKSSPAKRWTIAEKLRVLMDAAAAGEKVRKVAERFFDEKDSTRRIWCVSKPTFPRA